VERIEMNFAVQGMERLSAEEERALLGWGEDIFQIDSYRLSWRDQEWHFVGRAEGRPVSHVGVLVHDVSVAGLPVRVGGVAAVVTIPEARGHGYATRTLREAMDYLRDERGAQFGFLFCIDRMIPFYRNMGWEKVTESVMVDQPRGRIAYPMNAMTLPLADAEWPAGQVELNSRPW
jgi:GNAT superfamily N-acetyltransferase